MKSRERSIALKMLEKGLSPETVSDVVDQPLSLVQELLRSLERVD